MTAFIAITQVTVRQTLRLRRFLGLGLLSLSAGITFVLASLSPGQTSNNAFDLFLGITVGTFMNILVPVVTLITATSVMGDERRDNTMSFLVLRPVGRATIATAKVTAAFVEAFALSGIVDATTLEHISIGEHGFPRSFSDGLVGKRTLVS